MEKVRIDKWLWSVRIYKTRTLATDEVKAGRVRVNDIAVKPSHLISINDVVQVKKGGFNLTFKVLQLIEKRVGAPVAVTCYTDLTSPEELQKFAAWFIGKSGGEYREKGLGRPTKKDRREIDDFKTYDFFDDADE